jgi:5'(3')-deoxyribonucleotidase
MVSKERNSARQGLMSLIRHGERTHGTIVSIDIDQSLANVHEVMIGLYNKSKGTTYTVEDHKDWDFKSIGSNYNEMMSFYVDAWKNHWKEIKLMGHREGLIRSEEYFVQDISSSRDHYGLTGGTTDSTNKWLSMQGLNWLPVFFDATKIRKSLLAYQIYIDDSPKLADEIQQTGKAFQFLIDRPYNRYIRDSPTIMRVPSFDDASAEMIRGATSLGISKRHYQSETGQQFLRHGGIEARDRIVAKAMHKSEIN